MTSSGCRSKTSLRSSAARRLRPRQLASRARRRVQGADVATESSLERRREIVDAFLAASRGGDFGALLELLDPEVVLKADAAADRKSTRLNSSHVAISYAVFCLKKKRI